jgi:predicted extracellular nuclease
MDYAFGLYRIQPTQGADYTNANPRTPAPDPVGGTLEVATFNVLNYFTTLDNSGPICGPLANQDCRGADNATEFTRQRDKIVAAISAIDADVVGLMEIENHPVDVPTADLVSGLNDATSPGTYDYIATGAIGGDAIRVALLYQPASVTPLGGFAVLDSSVDPLFDDTLNRPMLVQSFVENATGAVFTVAVNHLKSKGSDCNAVGDPDTGDGSGNCNVTRTKAAQAIVEFLAGDPTGSGDSDVLIIGDLNSYDKEDPIDVLVGAGYADLVFDFLGEDAYSYVFDGQIGYLDYQLASSTLVPQVTGTTVWHINADEPDLIDYDTSFKQPAQDAIYAPDAYRSSDHDPVIVGLALTTARSQKESALGELEGLLPTSSAMDATFIQKAMDRIEESLTPSLWTGPSALDPKTGGRVFDREHQAVQALETVTTVDVQAAIDALVDADRQIALRQLSIAIVGGGDPGRIAQAHGNMADADANLAAGDYANAVLDYKKAWTNALKAL